MRAVTFIAASVGIAALFVWLLWRFRKSAAALALLLPFACVFLISSGFWFLCGMSLAFGAYSEPANDGLACGFGFADGLCGGLPLGLLLSTVVLVVSQVRRQIKQDEAAP
jgi:hypothetical protein